MADLHGQYTELPEFYDFLGKHPDYKAQAQAILGAYEKIGAKESGLILDLACGTGMLMREMLARGADVIGTDLSPEMLSVCRENCAKKGLYPLLLQQDMRQLDLYGTVDVCVCASNSLNYLPCVADLERVFALVHNFVTPDGLFFFDVNSLYKFERLYASNTYVFEGKGAMLVWQNSYSAGRRECTMDVTIFKSEGNDRYRRTQERQKQKYFSLRTIERLLGKCGFEIIFRAGDYAGAALKSDAADVFYLARCIKNEKGNRQ